MFVVWYLLNIIRILIYCLFDVDMNEGFAESTKYRMSYQIDVVFIQEANSCLYHLVKVRPLILFCMQDIDHAINQLSYPDTKVGRAKSWV